jgi:hypothetical protein
MPCPALSALQTYRLEAGPNERVTTSSASQSRAESVVGVNPTNARNLICASKKFIKPEQYQFTISTSYSFDGGLSWTESPLPLQQGWDGMTDPDLTFDANGHAYLIVEGDQFGPGVGVVKAIGMFVFKSVDGGKSWTGPVQLHLDADDDKQWIDADVSRSSPHFGSVYAVWAAQTNLRFARSTDGGVTWKGVGSMPAGSDMFQEVAYAPSLCIGSDGVIHISWHVPGNSEIRYTRSTDGGQTFSTPISAVTGMTSVTGSLPSTTGTVSGGQFPHFPNATFRVMTLVTSCIAAGNRLVIAWADNREGVTRIYYRVAANGGLSWQGPASGQSLLPVYSGAGLYHFHPQLSVAGNQAVGCAFYEFGLKNGKYAIDVITAFSCNDAAYFTSPTTVTENPWDPKVDAPFSHGDPNITFIGEYFGFLGASDWFAAVWTDTRTGVQELFYDTVSLKAITVPSRFPWEWVQIIEGVIQDGGGLVLAGGRILRIPPGDPWMDVLYALVAIDSTRQIRNEGATKAIDALRQIVASVAREQNVRGEGGGEEA